MTLTPTSRRVPPPSTRRRRLWSSGCRRWWRTATRHSVRAPRERLGSLSVSHSKRFCMALLYWAHRARNGPFRRFSARADTGAFAASYAVVRGAGVTTPAVPSPAPAPVIGGAPSARFGPPETVSNIPSESLFPRVYSVLNVYTASRREQNI
jgi:hypothetical protein